jgi:hypothetical protein
MTARRLVLALAAGAALMACIEETPEAAAPADAGVDVASGPQADDDQLAQPAAVGPAPVDGEIDWAAARAARAQGAVTDASGVVGVESVGSDVAVPVLLPRGVVVTASDRPPQLVATDDGYFATYETPRFDAIVNGSKRAYAAGSLVAPQAVSEQEMRFTLGEASAQLAFSRFGADYLIEFECREADGGESCISEDEAKAFADSLFVATTQ